LENLKRKSKAADVMFTELVKYMSDAMIIDQKQYTKRAEVPSWL
jgi:hypothetical protein